MSAQESEGAFAVTFGCENCGNEWHKAFPSKTVVTTSAAQMDRVVVNNTTCPQLLGADCECCYVIGCPVCEMGGGVTIDDRHPVGGDELDAYYERNLLALAFIECVRREMELIDEDGYACGWWDDDATDDEWVVVWVDDPNHGQFGWHVPRELLPDWLDERDPEYDGYSSEDKYERLKEGWIEG